MQRKRKKRGLNPNFVERSNLFVGRSGASRRFGGFRRPAAKGGSQFATRAKGQTKSRRAVYQSGVIGVVGFPSASFKSKPKTFFLAFTISTKTALETLNY